MTMRPTASDPGRHRGAASALRVAGRLALPVAAAFLISGCFDKPEIEDRWTRVDLESANMLPNQMVAPGSAVPITMRATITYRKILTGFAVAELRASTSVTAQSVVCAPDAPRVAMAYDIDRILAGSVTCGRVTRAVTGWDHLVMPLDLAFTGNVPSGVDSTGNPPSLFLLCYMGSGEEVEQQDGSDSLIVTPFPAAQYEILPIGMKLVVGP
jgi:hypothetical protein